MRWEWEGVAGSVGCEWGGGNTLYHTLACTLSETGTLCDCPYPLLAVKKKKIPPKQYYALCHSVALSPGFHHV